MPTVRYDFKKVNEKWAQQVKASSNLTEEEKKQLIKDAHKEVLKDNIIEFVVTTIGALIAFAIVACIVWLFNSR